MFTTWGGFGEFLAFEMGYDKYFREIIARYLLMPFYMSTYDGWFMSKDLCVMMWFS